MKINVSNAEDTPVPVRILFSGLDLQGEELLPAADKAIFDASSWFKADTDSIILAAKSRREISITIKPPANASPGGHYATVLFQPQVEAAKLSPNSARTLARVGALSFITIKGAVDERLNAGVLGTGRFRQVGPITFRLPVTNPGNVHVVPAATVRIKDWQGRVVGEVPLGPKIILPQTRQALEFNWDKKELIGRYTASLTMTYGSGKSTSAVPITFWVVPWALIFLATLGTGLLAFAILKTRKNWLPAIRAFFR